MPILPVGAAQAVPTVARCDGRPCVTGLSAPALFAVAADHEAQGRLGEAEAILEALTHDPKPEHRSEARFRLGKLRERRGDRAGAIAAYRAVLDEQPGANRVRLELARLLALDGDESGARRELRVAAAAGLPDDVARVVDQFATALRSRRRIGATVEVAIAPDSNINGSTRQRTIETVIADLPLSADARATSGVGLTISGQGFWRVPLDTTSLLTRLSGRADMYRDRRFRDISLTLASGPEFALGQTRLRPAALVSRRWYGGRRYVDSYGGTFNILRPLDRRSQIEAEATVLHGDYRTSAQSGTLYDANVTYDRAFDARTSGRITTRATRQDARDPGFATRSGGLDLLAARKWGRQTVFLQLGLSRTRADARLFLFPERRRDDRWDGTAGLLLRQWRLGDLSPVVRVTRTESRSTVGLYDFRRTRLEFALSREF